MINDVWEDVDIWKKLIDGKMFIFFFLFLFLDESHGRQVP